MNIYINFENKTVRYGVIYVILSLNKNGTNIIYSMKTTYLEISDYLYFSFNYNTYETVIKYFKYLYIKQEYYINIFIVNIKRVNIYKFYTEYTIEQNFEINYRQNSVLTNTLEYKNELYKVNIWVIHLDKNEIFEIEEIRILILRYRFTFIRYCYTIQNVFQECYSDNQNLNYSLNVVFKDLKIFKVY